MADLETAPPDLTRRERDVLVALCRPALHGHVFEEPASVREIAAALVVTEAAVKQHLLHLYDKFGIAETGERRRVRLAREAIRRRAVVFSDSAQASTSELPEVRYVRSGDVNIAYQIIGDGPVDLVFVPGFISNLESAWWHPSMAAFYRRLARFSRLIVFDKRGTSMSDRATGVADLETGMDDVRAVRRQLVRYRGRELDTAGEGVFASFDGPARAIRCACSVSDETRAIGVEVRIGLHTGECEFIDGKLEGIVVDTGARIGAEAGPGEVLVSSTLKDLVAGSDIEFRERTVPTLTGIPGPRQLFAVDRPAALADGVPAT